MYVETFAVGPLGCNCSIIADVVAKRAIVVDPGGDFDAIRARLDALGVGVDAIVHTHTHVDHVGATAELQRATGAGASIHEKDRFLYRMLPVQAALVGTHTPGHTPGSCCFVASDSEGVQLFAGDTLFRGSIGRTDLWGGDHAAILRSIRGKLLPLADDVVVVAGHGPSTTIGEERAHNPFLARMPAARTVSR